MMVIWRAVAESDLSAAKSERISRIDSASALVSGWSRTGSAGTDGSVSGLGEARLAEVAIGFCSAGDNAGPCGGAT
jgi:hypothetical protein